MCVNIFRLFGQLLIQFCRVVSFAAQRRTVDRGTDQCEMNARFHKLRPNLFVLDLIPAPLIPPDAPANRVSTPSPNSAPAASVKIAPGTALLNSLRVPKRSDHARRIAQYSGDDLAGKSLQDF